MASTTASLGLRPVAPCKAAGSFDGSRARAVLRSQAKGVVLRTTFRNRITCLAAKPETLATVQEVIATQLSVDPASVTPVSKFRDLGADSLDTVEIMMRLEESFKISLGEDGADKVETVQDAADMIEGVIAKNNGTA